MQAAHEDQLRWDQDILLGQAEEAAAVLLDRADFVDEVETEGEAREAGEEGEVLFIVTSDSGTILEIRGDVGSECRSQSLYRSECRKYA